MFENLKQAQRTGMAPRERVRLTLFAVALLSVGASLLLLKNCKAGLPGSRDLPRVEDLSELERLQRHVDKERLREHLGDEAASQGRFVEAALEQVRAELALGLGDVPKALTAAALSALPFGEAVGGLFEVSGRVTALVGTEYRSERERLWALVVQGDEGGQVVAVRLARATEPQQGVPTDAWKLAPAEVQVGDRVIVRGAYVQRRVGTVGSIGLADPTPVLLATAFRRVVEPAAVPIDEPSEASWDQVKDWRPEDSARLDDPALYQMIHWAREKGQAWFREQIDAGKIPVEEWNREIFDEVWSHEVELGNKRPPEPRPFTTGARGRLFRTSGLVGKVLREDWDEIRPNAWGINSYEYVYLWSDFYGNRVFPSISPFPFEAFGFKGWKPLRERVYLYGYFVKTYTFDTQAANPEGTGHQPLSMPLFVVVDIRPFPVGAKTDPGTTVAWVLGGMVVGLFVFFLVLMRGERREEDRERRHRTAMAMKRSGGFGPRPDAGDAAPPPPPAEPPP